MPRGTEPALITCRAEPPDPARETISPSPTVTDSTDGTDPEDSASRAGSPEVSTHRPSVAMPMGSTSYRSVSMADRIRPALAQDTACSVLRPPNTTATRILGCPTRPPVRPASQSPQAEVQSEPPGYGLLSASRATYASEMRSSASS